MLETLSNVIEVAQSIVHQRAHPIEVADKKEVEAREQALKVASTFVKLGLKDFEKGRPEYAFLIDDVAHQMSIEGQEFTLYDLGLAEQERSKAQELIQLREIEKENQRRFEEAEAARQIIASVFTRN